MNEERKIILSGFTFMKGEKPGEFEVCVIVEKDGHLSAGCWMNGVFRQGRGGVIDADNVLAWLPIEKVSIDINSYGWNPAMQLVARYCGFNDWYKTYSKELLDGYQKGKYCRLPDYE